MKTQSSYKDILTEILSILEYTEKEEYVDRFDRMNHLEAMSNIYETLPENLQNDIVNNANNPEIIMQLLDKETYTKELIQVTAQAFGKFIAHVQPTMTNSQKQQIANLLNSN